MPTNTKIKGIPQGEVQSHFPNRLNICSPVSRPCRNRVHPVLLCTTCAPTVDRQVVRLSLPKPVYRIAGSGPDRPAPSRWVRQFSSAGQPVPRGHIQIDPIRERGIRRTLRPAPMINPRDIELRLALRHQGYSGCLMRFCHPSRGFDRPFSMQNRPTRSATHAQSWCLPI